MVNSTQAELASPKIASAALLVGLSFVIILIKGFFMSRVCATYRMWQKDDFLQFSQ